MNRLLITLICAACVITAAVIPSSGAAGQAQEAKAKKCKKAKASAKRKKCKKAAPTTTPPPPSPTQPPGSGSETTPPAPPPSCFDGGADDTPTGATDLGSVSGDTSPMGNQVSMSTTICPGDHDWYSVLVTEDSVGADVDLTARAMLTMEPVAAGVDGNLDLATYCFTAAGASKSSTNAGTTAETIGIGRDDATGDRSFTLFIEVDGGSGVATNAYTLSLTGNVVTSDRTCN